MTIKENIMKVLREHPDTRNSDALLQTYVWYAIMPGAFRLIDGKWYISVEKFRYELPSSEAIRRQRAQIQNEFHEFEPTNQIIKERRKRRRENWRDDILNV